MREFADIAELPRIRRETQSDGRRDVRCSPVPSSTRKARSYETKDAWILDGITEQAWSEAYGTRGE